MSPVKVKPFKSSCSAITTYVPPTEKEHKVSELRMVFEAQCFHSVFVQLPFEMA